MCCSGSRSPAGAVKIRPVFCRFVSGEPLDPTVRIGGKNTQVSTVDVALQKARPVVGKAEIHGIDLV